MITSKTKHSSLYWPSGPQCGVQRRWITRVTWTPMAITYMYCLSPRIADYAQGNHVLPYLKFTYPYTYMHIIPQSHQGCDRTATNRVRSQ